MRPAAVYVWDYEEEYYARRGTWPRVPPEQGLDVWGRINIRVDVDECLFEPTAIVLRQPGYHRFRINLPRIDWWKPVLGPPPAPRATHREPTCRSCRHGRPLVGFPHLLQCVGPARDEVADFQLAFARQPVPLVTQGDFYCKHYRRIDARPEQPHLP